MFEWGPTFLAIALVTCVLGFGGMVIVPAQIAKTGSFVILVLFLIAKVTRAFLRRLAMFGGEAETRSFRMAAP